MASQGKEKQEQKISDIEVILIGLILVTADAIGILLFFFAIDDFGMTELLVGAPLLVYYWAKGLLGLENIEGKAIRKYLPRIIVQFVGEGVPYVGVAPWYSIIFATVVWTDRHPKAAAVVQKAAEAKGGKGGKAGAVGAEKKALEEAAKKSGGGMAEGLEEARETRGSAGEVRFTGETDGGGASTSGGTSQEGSADKKAGSGSSVESGGTRREGQGSEEDQEGGGKSMSVEEQRMENIIRGRDIENVMLDEFGADQILRGITAPESGSESAKFNPDTAMDPKAPRQWKKRQDNKDAKGIINSEEVDLKNKEFLQDAA